MGLKYDTGLSNEYFKKVTNLSLNEKIKLSKEIITEFVEHICEDEDKIYIACSFGKDSIVLVDLVRQLYPSIPIVFSDTGLEYKGIYKLKEKYDNVFTVAPLKSMKEVIEEEGYILPIGKAKCKSLRIARKWIKEENWENGTFKFLGGWGNCAKGSLFNQESALKHIIAPFPISEKCDNFLKKKPLDNFLKEKGFKYRFTGITYDESRYRQAILLRDGFNNEYNSRPIGHWNTNDVLEYIYTYGLEYSDSYGEIIKTDNGYETTLFKRTGCCCCPCGSHLEKKPNRYQLLYNYDYDAWKYVIYELNFKKVLDYFEVPYYPNEITSAQDDLDKYF